VASVQEHRLVILEARTRRNAGRRDVSVLSIIKNTSFSSYLQFTLQRPLKSTPGGSRTLSHDFTYSDPALRPLRA
jgi:hypothetical protein